MLGKTEWPITSSESLRALKVVFAAYRAAECRCAGEVEIVAGKRHATDCGWCSVGFEHSQPYEIVSVCGDAIQSSAPARATTRASNNTPTDEQPRVFM